MTNQSSSYDPEDHRTPTTERRQHPRAYTHARHYDAGLVPPPISLARSGRFIAVVVVTSALAVLGSVYAIGQAGNNACVQRQETAQVLREIIAAGDPDIDQFVVEGTLTAAQGERIHQRNADAIKRLTFPSC